MPSTVPAPRATRFRFKARPRKRPRSASPAASPSETDHSAAQPAAPHSDDRPLPTSTPPKPRRHRAHRAATPDRALDSPPPSPETAFRTALFESLSSTDRAAHWADVYGQPLHVYARDAGASDEQYVAHVRACMWERSEQHVAEERARRADERARARIEEHRREKEQREKEEESEREEEQDRWASGDSRAWDGLEEEGWTGESDKEREKRCKDEQKRWDRYVTGWDTLVGKNKAMGSTMEGVEGEDRAEARVPWPTASGDLLDVSGHEVEMFFAAGARATDPGSLSVVMPVILKAERVRWHPDKVAQRLGPGCLNFDDAKGVTAVFQIVDALYAKWVARGKMAS